MENNFMMENGKMISRKIANFFFNLKLFMKVSFVNILFFKEMVKDFILMKIVVFMKENSYIIKGKEKELYFIKIIQSNLKGIGKMINGNKELTI
jgi:hypothetical protein